MITTAGQALINSKLPNDLQDYDRVLNKKNIKKLFVDVAKRYPEKYSNINYSLKKIGEKVAQIQGSSPRLEDFMNPVNLNPLFDKAAKDLGKKLIGVTNEKERLQLTADVYTGLKDVIEKKVFDKALANENVLAQQVVSGARGNPSNLNSTIGAPVMYSDNMGRPIPIPIKHSYSEGLDPAEAFASSFGSRKGYISVKMATPKGGYFSKQVSYVLDSTIITDDDCGTKNGILEPTDDPYNIGRILAKPAGHYPAGTSVDHRVISDLLKKNINKIEIRSPITCEATDGICKKCRGTVENGQLPGLGDNVGINSALAASEPFTQGSMDDKHTGGLIGSGNISGFKLVQQLLKIPKVFPGKAAVAEEDGVIEKIVDAPQGGQYVFINNKRHFVNVDCKVTKKVGDEVDQGDVISTGIQSPAETTKYKGIGQSRRNLFDSLRQACIDDGKNVDKVHMETLARGMINHVKIDNIDDLDDNVPGDVVLFSHAQKNYNPKDMHKEKIDKKVKGLYLAKPSLHYTVGTKIDNSVIKGLKESGATDIMVSSNPPGFTPQMTRLDDIPSHNPNWIARLYSTKLKDKTLNAMYRGDEAELHSTSFIPSYIYGKEFGKPKIKY